MLWKKNRDDLKNQKKEKHSSKTAKRFLFGQACGGTGNLLMTYAISIASVTLVQALQGTQYIFVFLGVLFLTFYFPRILKEKVTREIILQKTIAILLIISGIWFILI